MSRNNILLQRLPAPKRVKLPNGRVFFAKYQGVGRDILPERVRIRRTYVRKIGPRRQRISCRRQQQVSRGLDQNAISSALDLGSRAATSRLGKIMINDAIDYISTAYKNIKNKIKNKKVKAVLNARIDGYFVNKGIDLVGERFK